MNLGKPTTITTELARLELTHHDLVMVHLHPDVKITADRVKEVRQARHSLVSGIPVAMFVVAPGEPDWQASDMGTDFFGPEEDRIKALAVMANGTIFSTVVNLYFGLNPGKCPVRVVDTMEAGYAWLANQGFASGKAVI